MGGFHLKANDLQTGKTIAFLRQHKVQHVLPSHCTDLPALSAFNEAFGANQIKTGMTFTF